MRRGRHETRTHPDQIETICDTCGHHYFLAPSHHKGRTSHYCSRTCHIAALNKHGGSRYNGGLQGAIERAQRHVTPEGCWLWQDYVDAAGYGQFSTPRANGRRLTSTAHRAVYRHLVGPIPPGMHLDHVYERGCRHKHCVNPAHLELVTKGENSRRRWQVTPTRRKQHA